MLEFRRMTDKKPVIILLGPQGSGKGTQGKVLAEKLGVPYLETGQLLRNEIATGSALGKRFASFMDQGNLVPPEDAIALMSTKIREAVKSTGGAVIDGFPRSPEQAQGFPEDITPTHVLAFELPKDESIKRLSARRVCPKDKQVYNVLSQPSKEEGICDLCGTPLEQRHDDTPEAIAQRLDVYHAETEPVIALYEPQGIVHRIDGTPSIPEVTQSVAQLFS